MRRNVPCFTRKATTHCPIRLAIAPPARGASWKSFASGPARIIGAPRTAQYACIEPVDLEVEPIRCCWDVVDMVMRDGGAFVRDDDDTDE